MAAGINHQPTPQHLCRPAYSLSSMPQTVLRATNRKNTLDVKTKYPAVIHRLCAKIQFARMAQLFTSNQTLHPGYHSCHGYYRSAQKQYAPFHAEIHSSLFQGTAKNEVF